MGHTILWLYVVCIVPSVLAAKFVPKWKKQVVQTPLQSIKFVSEDFEFIRRVNYPPLTVNTPTTFVRTMEK